MRLETCSKVTITKRQSRRERMPSTSNFKAKLSDLQHDIESAIDRYLPESSTRPDRLHSAMRYSMEAGGKRLRPALALAVSEIFGRRDEALPVAIALECIHTYSLIHDDLPAMDDDDLRRGRATLHKKFDEATAILAGDALLTHAFAMVANHYAVQPELAVRLIREIAVAAGSEKLIGGQMADMLGEKQPISADELGFIHAGKTAALITASVVCGGIVGGATDEQLSSLRRLGYHLGLAFQVVDDILDATATSDELGKTVGKDQKAQKATMVALHGLGGARAKAREHTEAAASACSEIPGKTSFLRDLIRSLEHRAN